MDCKLSNLEAVRNYHQQTKHRFECYSTGPDILDWSNQPNPFRRYTGTQFIRLPLNAAVNSPGDLQKVSADQLQDSPQDYPPDYSRLFYDDLPPQPVNVQTVASLLRNSLALSAWKQAGDSLWPLRVNPSSGNLHPTEGYLLCGAIDGLSTSANLFHYTALEHGLEKRCELPEALWHSLTKTCPADVFFIGLSSIYWRESWKYGERAFRYCHLDVGHAIAAVCLAASSSGWRCDLLNELSQEQLRKILGLKDDYLPGTEHPDCLLAISSGGISEMTISAAQAIDEMSHLTWYGEANSLSEDHVAWPIINEVARACEKPLTTSRTVDISKTSRKALKLLSKQTVNSAAALSAQQIIQQRRSALAMDGETPIADFQFYTLLSRLLPQHIDIPYAALSGKPQVHMLFFIHRVTGLEPGLYLLVRANDHLEDLKRQLRGDFSWLKPEACPAEISLFQLLGGDARQISRQLSCGQEIAADGCFCIAMLTRFDDVLQHLGPWAYPQLYWECGLIGQVLYLEAESIGLRGTGIGCFFDDPVHELIGLADQQYQVLYHFTIGGHVEDSRLQSLPAYNEP